MIVIWRGFGWLVPIVFIAMLIATQMGVDAIFGVDDYYKDYDWPFYAAIGLSSMILAAVGFYLNYVKRVISVNEITGKKKKSPSHSLFFIPIEIWALLVPLCVAWMEYGDIKSDKQDLVYLEQPAVNDLYLSDYSKMFDWDDKEYRYGILKVKSVSDENVQILVGNMAYKLRASAKEDVLKNKVFKKDYFRDDMFSISREHLANLKNEKAIRSVIRKVRQ